MGSKIVTLLAPLRWLQCNIARPWQLYAKVVIMNSELSDNIKSEEWHNWNDPEKEQSVFYVEFGNSGPGFTPGYRVS